MADRKRNKAGGARLRTEQPQKADQAEQPLTVAERNLLAEFQERKDARHRVPRVKVIHRPPNSVGITPAEGEPKTAEVARLVAFGTTSTDFYSRTFQELLDPPLRKLAALAVLKAANKAANGEHKSLILFKGCQECQQTLIGVGGKLRPRAPSDTRHRAQQPAEAAIGQYHCRRSSRKKADRPNRRGRDR